MTLVGKNSEKNNQNLMQLIRRAHGLVENPDLEKHRQSQDHIGELLGNSKEIQYRPVDIDGMDAEWVSVNRAHMKKYLIVALVALSVITAFGFLIHQNKKLRRERDAYHNNTEVLLSEVERYQTKSGEQAVRVGELQLRVAELERYRADDAALIRDMGVKKKELEQLTKIQQQTIYKLQGKARDTVFVEVTPDRAAEVPARCAEHHDEWLDFSCCIFPDNSYKADVISRDRITYVERVKYARFLGFLWRTKRVKSRDQSIINHNPHAEIIDAEFITIRK